MNPQRCTKMIGKILVFVTLFVSSCSPQALPTPEELVGTSVPTVPSEMMFDGINPEEGGTIETGDGFSIYFDPYVLPQATTIAVKAIEIDPGMLPSDAIPVSNAYEVTMEGDLLDGRAFIGMPYDPAVLPEGSSEEDIVIAYFAEDLQQWVVLPSDVDVENHLVSAGVNHFSTFLSFLWPSKNKLPIIINFQFSPTAFPVDCDQITSVEAFSEYLVDHPNSLVLTVDDPDGLDDIVETPEVQFRSEYVYARDKDSEWIPMEKVSPGNYSLSITHSVGQYNLWGLFEVLTGTCGNLRTYTATVRVKDKSGNRVEQSAVQDFRYEQLPTLTLTAPLNNEPTSLTPTFTWSLIGDPQIINRYEKFGLIVSNEPSLRTKIVEIELPISQQSYTIPSDQPLKANQQYYWQITVRKPYQEFGSIWRYFRSQMASFATSGVWVDLTVDDTVVNRSEVSGNIPTDLELSWVATYNGEIVIPHHFGNEMSLDILEYMLTYFTDEDKKSGDYQVWLDVFDDEANEYRRISNIVTVTIDIQPTFTLSSNAYCRSGPGLDYGPAIKWPMAGDVLPVKGRLQDNSYFVVEVASVLCWIKADTGTLKGNPNSIPVVEPPPTPKPVPAAVPTQTPKPYNPYP